MKKYILALFSIATLTLNTGCEDFLDKPQLDKVEDKDFWRNEADFRMYSVEFYHWFLSGYNSGYGVNFAPLRGYTFSDDVLTGGGTQENFISSVPSTLAVTSDPSKLLEKAWYREYNGDKWNFGWVRKANIMIQRVEQYKANLSDAAYKHWMGVARFFRAYAYFNLVASFGDVPYFDKPIDDTDPDTFYKDRDERGFVMDKVYEDLKYAIENTYELDNASSQYVNKYLIAALASRFMLFEGTWQKYHNLSAERAKKYLEFCVEASEVVMNTGKYSCSKDFHSIFGSDDLKGHPEVIFYRHYATAKATHCLASYSNGQESQAIAPNLELLKAFICKDGQPYQHSIVANAQNFDMATLAKTRDPRFESTFFDFPLETSGSLAYANKFTSREGTKYWNDPSGLPTKYGSSLNENDAPIVRYAEVLLDWIEAKTELAETYGSTSVTQNDIDISINAIRKRPLDAVAIGKGVEQTAPLLLASLPDDPNRDADISKLLWEIRRERRMEFVFEHTRLLDIKRWKKIEYMDNKKYPDTMFGPWVDFPTELPSYQKEEFINILAVRKADGTEVVYDGTNWPDMVGYFKVKNAKARDTFNPEKAYVSPVGIQEIQDYKDQGYTLAQTVAWR